MEQLNRVELHGCVGAIRRSTVQGRMIAQLTVATNYAYKDADGCAVIECTWHTVRAWEGKNIRKDVLENLEKGDKVSVIGRIRNQRYVGEDGTERYAYEIVANAVSKIDTSEALSLEM